jgi:hypothetical protein
MRTTKQRASSLLVVLVVCTILALATMGYLSLTEQQNRLSFRSQSWNVAIAVVEAGLEEALQQLNSNTANLASDGWTWDGRCYARTQALPDGNSYTVTIDFSVDPFHPTIICRAFVNPPTLAQNQERTVFFAAAGVPTPPLSRAVRLHCARGNLLIKGMVAKHKIDMNGQDILTDSFDSSDPAHSTSGRYPVSEPAKLEDNGDVATNDSFANSLNAGNANLYGHVMTGPGGSVAVGVNGAVGEHSWQPGHSGQIEPGWYMNTANFTFPEQILPYAQGAWPLYNLDLSVTNYYLATNSSVTGTTYPNPVPYGGVVTGTVYTTTSSWPNRANTVTNCANSANKTKQPPPAGTYCGTPWQTGNDANWWYWYSIANYTYPSYTYTYNLYSTNYTVSTEHWDYVLDTGDYSMPSGVLAGKTLVRGNARLVVPNGINMSGTDKLQISQLGSLQIYAAGPTCTIGGNGVINQNGYAVNCEIFCTPTVTAFNFNGNGEFIGVLVAPEAFVTMNGGGHSVNDFIGALMADSIKMNGHYKFHYDEALGKNGANSRYIVTSWDEIDPTGF